MFDALQRWFRQHGPTRRDGVTTDPLRTAHQHDALWTALNGLCQGARAAVADRTVVRCVEALGDPNVRAPADAGKSAGETPFTRAVRAERWALALRLMGMGADPYAGTQAFPLFNWKSVRPVGTWGLAPEDSYQGAVPAMDLALLQINRLSLDRMTPPGLWSQAWLAADAWLARRAKDGVVPTLHGGSSVLHQLVLFDSQLRHWTVERLLPLGVNVPDAHGHTPLHLAMDPGIRRAHGILDGAVLLIQAGADPYAPDARGHSPLHMLAENVQNAGVDPTEMLRLASTFPDLDWARPDPTGLTPLAILDQPERDSTWTPEHHSSMDTFLQQQRVMSERRALNAMFEPDGAVAGLGTLPSRGRSRL